VRHGAGQWPGAQATLLLEEQLFAVAAPSIARGVTDPADVARLPLVSDNARQGWHDWFREARVRGITPDERFRFTDSTGALEAAATGLGAVLAREHVVAPYLANGRLVRLPGPAVRARWAYYVVVPTHRRPRAAARQFIDWLLEQARAVDS
jgi:DNA-binding transcriptional LysR family regulator